MGIIQTSGALVFALALLLFWALGGWHSPHTEIEKLSATLSTPKPKTFSVVSFNTAWFYGMGSEGPGYVPKPNSHFLERLESSSNWLKAHSPDLVLLQEVDFHASRSQNIDELATLSKLTGLSHSAKAVSWDVNYLPFPYFPFTSHWGRIESGGGVLSRSPILSQTVQLLKKPSANFFLYNQFYLFRYLQIVDLGFGLAINLHLEAFDQPNRLEHIQALKQVIHMNRDRIWIVGGDFNTPEFAGVDFAPLTRAQDDAKTFPTTGAEIRLDHIWYNPQFLKPLRHRVGTDLNTSDHYPILSEFTVL